MLIGLTYDLKEEYLAEGFGEMEVAEFDSERTIAALESALQNLGHQVERIGHVRSLTQRLADGQRWDLVFNISEGLYGYGREAQVPALLDAYRIPYTFSDPLTLCLSLNKAVSKRMMQSYGLPTASFFLVEKLVDLNNLTLPFPLFAKPVAEGSSKGVSAESCIHNKTQLKKTCSRLLKEFKQPVLVEKYLSGEEFTVGMVGTGDTAKVIGIFQIILTDQAEQGGYSYENKVNYEDRVKYQIYEGTPLAAKIKKIALACWRNLGGCDAGRIDIRCDGSGEPYILELNPLAGLTPDYGDIILLSQAVGISYQKLISLIMRSAMQRLNLNNDSDADSPSKPVAEGQVLNN